MRDEPIDAYRRYFETVARNGGNLSAASRELNIPRETLRGKLAKARRLAAMGYFGTDPVIPGFEIAKISTTTDSDGNVRQTSIQQRPIKDEPDIPEGMRLERLSVNISPSGEVQRWEKYKADAPDPAAIAKAVREAFEGYEPPAPAIIKEVGDPNRMNVFPIADIHQGLRTWRTETGEDYDHEIGAELIRTKMAQLFAETAPATKALIVNLGDALHANDHKNMTPTSGNLLDVSAGLLTVTRSTVALFRDCIDMALQMHDEVSIVHLPGNHDLTSSIALIVAAEAHYANEPRVKVFPAEDELERDVFFLRYGQNLLGAHHGHRLRKPEEMAMCMASECRADWGETGYHWFFYGHIHNATVKEVGGCLVESFRTIAPPDGYAVSKFQSGRSLTSVTLNECGGEHGRKHINLPPLTRRAKAA